MPEQNNAPLAVLNRFGIQAREEQPFHVAGDHSLSLVRAAVAEMDGGYRLYAAVEHADQQRAPIFRCVVGRPTNWPYPSAVTG